VTTPTATRPTVRDLGNRIYVHTPASDPDHPANTGRCIAWAFRRPRSRWWEVRQVGVGLVGEHRTRREAADQLHRMTGATL
jgi:hypothetical protein